jgi:predicted acylesterase/phospholipase RssA
MYEIGALAALDDFLSGGDLPVPPHPATPGEPPPTAREPRGFRSFSVTDFDVYVGTSAGAFVATMLASGMSVKSIFRAVLDDDRSALPARRTDIFRFDWRQGLGIARDLGGVLLQAAARAARRRGPTPGELLGELLDVLPAGVFSLRHYEKYLERFLEHHGLPTRFSELQRELYITANDLDSGHRAIFGQGDLLGAPLAKAICASSAIPLCFEPVRFAGRDFVDGAAGKVAHGDIALARGAELVVVVNPLIPVRNDPDREALPTPIAGASHLRDKGLLAVWQQAGKMSTRTKLHQELRRYRASHPQVSILLVEPREEEGDMFLHNPMSFASRRRVVRYGYDSTARMLKQQPEVWEAAFGKERVRVDAGRLRAPWALRG